MGEAREPQGKNKIADRAQPIKQRNKQAVQPRKNQQKRPKRGVFFMRARQAYPSRIPT
jgi:hypothetical protein